MKHQHWFRKFFFLSCLSASLFVVSCSQWQGPSPIAPDQQAKKRASSPPNEETPPQEKITPILRLSVQAHALAKGNNQDKAARHLQDLIDELQYIVDMNPGTTAASKLGDAVKKLQAAIIEINKPVQSNTVISGILNGAIGDIQIAIATRLIDVRAGVQFISEIVTTQTTLLIGSRNGHDCRGQRKSLWMQKSKGGLISYCGHQIIVPANALTKDTEMSVSVDKNDYITVDFGPDMWFQKPITIIISYKDADLTGTDPKKLTVSWYDTATGQWIAVPCTVDTVKQTVKAIVSHFTQYTISTR